MYKESTLRTILKTISWRILATLTTFTLVYIFVGRLEVAAIVGGFEVVAKMILYYAHERGWNLVKKGRYSIKPFVLWFTGLPKSGKTTLAKMVTDYIKSKGYKVEHLDGTTIRSIFPKTGFSKEERNRHIGRIGYLASMLEKNNVIVVASFISPYKEMRDFVRKICNNFIEVYVYAPAEVCEKRDTEGLYERAKNGEIPNFTGISDPYEEPENPEIFIYTTTKNEEESFKDIVKYIKKYI